MGLFRSRSAVVRGHQDSNSTPPLTTTLRRTASSASHRRRVAAPTPPSRARSQSTSAMGEMTAVTTVLVGRTRQAFIVNRRRLCAASPFFRNQLQHKTHSSPMAASAPCSVSSASSSGDGFHTYQPITLWLPGESTTMFGLFVEWLHSPSSFRSFLDEKAALAHGDGDEATQLLHWALVRLHLFAARLGLPVLQDLAMDAIQDLYLRSDWDIALNVIAYLYMRCEARHAVRLRRWAVAMVAFSLTVPWHLNHEQGGATTASNKRGHQRLASPSSSSASAVCDPARLHSMLDALPDFKADYATHVRIMRSAGLDMRFKNPQLRIPANSLLNDKRIFGFRECSFHTHRAAVGQGPCPHAASGLRAAETGTMLDLAPPEEEEEEEEEEGEDESDDDTRQWEREWADEYRALKEAAEYTYAPTTSLRPSPPPTTMARGLSRAGDIINIACSALDEMAPAAKKAAAPKPLLPPPSVIAAAQLDVQQARQLEKKRPSVDLAADSLAARKRDLIRLVRHQARCAHVRARLALAANEELGATATKELNDELTTLLGSFPVFEEEL